MTTNVRSLAWAAYAVAFLLIVLPLAEAAVGVWPMRVGSVSWRFGAAGLLSQVVVTPLLGMLLAITTAAVLGHRVLTRVLSVLTLLGAVLGILALVMFGLDSLQTRARVRPEAMGAFNSAAVVAFVKYGLGTITALLLGIGGWRASRKRAPDVAGARSAAAAGGKSAAADDDSRVLIGGSDGPARGRS